MCNNPLLQGVGRLRQPKAGKLSGQWLQKKTAESGLQRVRKHPRESVGSAGEKEGEI